MEQTVQQTVKQNPTLPLPLPLPQLRKKKEHPLPPHKETPMTNPNDHDAQQPSSTAPSSPMTPESKSPPLSASSTAPSKEPCRNSSTTGDPSANPCAIGKPLSETVLESLRHEAEKAKAGNEVTDVSLRALLQQGFGSRLAIRENHDGKFELSGYEITIADMTQADLPYITAIEFFNRPARPDQVAGLITRMRVSLVRRSEENSDAEMLIDTMTQLCYAFPFDVLRSVTLEWLRREKFFPVPSEFLAKLTRRMFFRSALLHACQLSNVKKIQSGFPASDGKAWQPPTEEEKAEVSRIVAETIKQISTNSAPL